MRALLPSRHQVSLLYLGLLIGLTRFVTGEDYRKVPLTQGDISFYVNAVCQSRGRIFVGGELNKVGQAEAFNFGYFEDGRFVSPPVSVGPDPSTLMYSSLTYGQPLESPNWEGKVLSLACPARGDVVVVAGDFAFGGRRVVPGWAAAAQNLALNHIGIFRLDSAGNPDGSNFCPVGRQSLSDDHVPRGTRHDEGEPALGKKLQKASCTKEGKPLPDQTFGAVMLHPSSDINGPAVSPPRAFISSTLCLTDDCTELVVGGRFNSILGTVAHSVALLRFDPDFYSAIAVSLQEVPGSWSSSDPLAPPPRPAASLSSDTCVTPIPGVDGSVFSLAVVGKWLIIGGSFTKAGAVNVNNVAAWDTTAREAGSGRLVCLGHEKGGNTCPLADYCCQGFPGSVRTLVSISSTEFLVGGFFSDLSSPSGTPSFNMALVQLDNKNDDQKGGGLQGWTRRPIIDAATGLATAPNGVITSARCANTTTCQDILIGGWFDGLVSYEISADMTISAYNATLWGLLSAPLSLLHVPTDSSSPATITAINVTQEVPGLQPPSHLASTSPGINAILPLPGGSLLLAGHLPHVGNIGALDTDGFMQPFVPPSLEDDEEEGGGPDWTTGECWDLHSRRPYLVQNRSASFCCRLGSMCPYEGLAVPCPVDGGYYCLGNQTEPSCCAAGFYCPSPGITYPCDKGFYCPSGSTWPHKCGWWQWCHKERLSRPDKIMGGVYALCFVAALFIIVRLSENIFLRLRAYFRQVRDTARRAQAGARLPRGGGSSTGNNIRQGGDTTMTVKQHELRAPLLGGGGHHSSSATGDTASTIACSVSESSRPPSPSDDDGSTSLGSSSSHNSSDTNSSSRGAASSSLPPRPPSVSSDAIEGDRFVSSSGGGGGGGERDVSYLPPPPPGRGSRSVGGGGARTKVELSSHHQPPPPPPPPSVSSYYYRERRQVDRIDLHFQGLTVELPGQKKVLQGATGGFRAGRVTAVMGPSGCGKTTLISALSNRLGLGCKITGRTFINGAAESCAVMHDLMGFVPQDDIMHNDLTVKENLLYCCQLRSDPSMSRAEQGALVQRVIESLGLMGSRHSMIGSTEERGISGGQRKRVNVAMELISQPLVLFLDEPTSGLDSTTAEELMQYLKKLTGTGLTVGAVIHQPRIEVFLGIDDVIFVGRGGRVAYYGAATDAVSYFESLGYTFAPQVNPADRILDIITKGGDSLYEAWNARVAAALHQGQTAGSSDGLARRFGFWSQQVPSTPGPSAALSVSRDVPQTSFDAADGGLRKGSHSGGAGVSSSRHSTDGSTTMRDRPRLASGDRDQRKRRQLSADGSSSSRRPLYTIIEEQIPARNYPSLAAQAWTCFWRSMRQQHNSLPVARQDLLFLLTFGFLCGLFDLNMTNYELSVLCMGLTSTVFGVRFFSTERVVFWRECSSGISIPAYFLGKVVSAVPLMLLYPLAFLAFNYSMAFPRVDFLFYYLALMWAGWVCFGVGVIMSLVLEPKNAQIGGVVAALVGFLFGGHNPPVSKLSSTAIGRIGMDMSYVRWAIGALFIREASFEPSCSAWFIATGLANTGYLPQDELRVPPQLFNRDSLNNDVDRCFKLLQVIGIAYLLAAMLLMWLSGKWRARMIRWDFIRVSCNQRRLKTRRACLDFLYRQSHWIPLWFIDAMAGYSPVMEKDEEEEEDDDEGAEDEGEEEANEEDKAGGEDDKEKEGEGEYYYRKATTGDPARMMMVSSSSRGQLMQPLMVGKGDETKGEDDAV